MLKQETNFYLIIIIFLFSFCGNREIDLYKKSLENIGEQEYRKIYTNANDSIRSWALYNLGYYSYLGKSKNYYLDSLICYNTSNTKFVTCILEENLSKEANNNGIEIFYGEKIQNVWYFFSGAFITTQKKTVKNELSKNASFYQQLHEIALEEVYKSYLKKDGEINEAWFDYNFSGGELGTWNEKKHAYDGPNNKEEYEFARIAYCKGMWMKRYDPYSENDFSLNYNTIDKTLEVKYRLKTSDSIYLKPTEYKILYSNKNLGYIKEGTKGSVYVDWDKDKLAHCKFLDIPDNTEFDISVEQIFFPSTVGKRMGPFKFRTSNGKVLVNRDSIKQLP